MKIFLTVKLQISARIHTEVTLYVSLTKTCVSGGQNIDFFYFEIKLIESGIFARGLHFSNSICKQKFSIKILFLTLDIEKCCLFDLVCNDFYTSILVTKQFLLYTYT